MALTRIALVSDVHGNITAYEAVLADIASRGITRVINLGDVVGKGPRGAACTDLTRERCEATVRGNWEVFVASPEAPEGEGPAWWHGELGAERRDWLLGLPGSLDLRLSGRIVRLVHASPIDEFTRVHRDPDPETFAMMFEPTPFTGDGPSADVLVYGDIHDAFLEMQGERTLVNVGSVGNPLDGPVPSYVILEGDDGADGADGAAPFGVQFVRVPYDVEAEIAVAHERVMPAAEAWEIELRTGIYRGRHAALGLTAA